MRPVSGKLLASALIATALTGCSSSGTNTAPSGARTAPQGYAYAADACAKVATVTKNMTSAEAIGPLKAAETDAEKAAAANSDYEPLHQTLKYLVTLLSSQGGVSVADGQPAWTQLARQCSNV